MELLKNIDFSDKEKIALTQQRTLRRLVGLLGVFLPISLYVFLLIYSGFEKPLESISHYYFTRVGGIFVITLSLWAIFLMIYKGKGLIDFIVSTIAGVFALFVVLFPTSNIDVNSESIVCSVTKLIETECEEDFRIMIHFISAAIFILSLAFMALFIFTKSKAGEEKTKQKKIRNFIYRLCGIAMIAAMLVIFLDYKEIICLPIFGESLTFWMETIAVESFGFAWLVKAEFFFKDKPKNNE